LVGATVKPTSLPTHRRAPRFAAGALLASLLLLAPATARAQEAPPPKPQLDVRLGFEAGPVGLLDAGAVNRALARAGYSTLSPIGAINGGTFAFEFQRFHIATGVFGTTFPSTSSVFGQRLVLVDVGYRVLGRPRSWGITPLVGLGVADATLTVGPSTTPSAQTFGQALQSRTLQQLDATSMLVHAGVLFDLFDAYDAPNKRGVMLSASAGFLGAPLSTAWAPMTPNAPGNMVSGSPHVPGTGPYGTVRVTLVF